MKIYLIGCLVAFSLWFIMVIFSKMKIKDANFEDAISASMFSWLAVALMLGDLPKIIKDVLEERKRNSK